MTSGRLCACLPPPADPRPAPRASASPWEAVELAPVLLVSGAEGLLADRAVDRVVALARAADAGVEVTRLDAADYTVGTLGVVTSPSLFAEDKVVVVDGLERATDELLSDVTGYLAAPPADVVLVLRHAGGQRGKKLLDTLRASGVPDGGVRRDQVGRRQDRLRHRRAAPGGPPRGRPGGARPRRRGRQRPARARRRRAPSSSRTPPA